MLEALAFIVNATNSASAGGTLPVDIAKAMHKAEPSFIVIKEDVPSAPGTVFVYATSAGIAASGAPAQSAPPATPGAPKTEFQLDKGIVMPESKRGGIKGDTYPFASMELNDSFFVAATDAKPNPAKGLASTVSSANKRFASVYPLTVGKDKKPHEKAGQPTGQDGRKFAVRARTVADGEKVNGARVWRIA